MPLGDDDVFAPAVRLILVAGELIFAGNGKCTAMRVERLRRGFGSWQMFGWALSGGKL